MRGPDSKFGPAIGAVEAIRLSHGYISITCRNTLDASSRDVTGELLVNDSLLLRSTALHSRNCFLRPLSLKYILCIHQFATSLASA